MTTPASTPPRCRWCWRSTAATRSRPPRPAKCPARARGDPVAAPGPREVLAPAASSTGAYWRGETLRAWVEGQPRRAALGAEIVKALLPGNPALPRMQPPTPALLNALPAINEAREALDRGDSDEAIQKARQAVAERGD